MCKGHKVGRKKKKKVFLVLSPDCSYRPFKGEWIPNEHKPWNTMFYEIQTLHRFALLPVQEGGIVSVISRCMYKGGYFLLSQQELLWSSPRCFPPPLFPTLADRCCHCCYFDTGFVLQLVELIIWTTSIQPSKVPVISHRRINRVLADIY